MIRWHKFISVILHPIVMPTIGVLLYFIMTPLMLQKRYQYAILSIIFITTYVIPLLLLIFLKAIKHIESYNVHTIKERKIPLFFMITLFFILGKSLFNIPLIRDLGYLFYGTTLAMVIVYFFFFFKIKASLHLLSMGSAIGFFLIFQQLYNVDVMPIVGVLVFLSGVLATSRLYLEAHIPKEVYLGFFIGFFSQFITYYVLIPT